MKYTAKALVVMAFLTLIGCGMGDNGELIGVQGRRPWFHPQPYGTVYPKMISNSHTDRGRRIWRPKADQMGV